MSNTNKKKTIKLAKAEIFFYGVVIAFVVGLAISVTSYYNHLDESINVSIGETIVQNEEVTYRLTGIANETVFISGKYADGSSEQFQFSSGISTVVSLIGTEKKFRIIGSKSEKGVIYLEEVE